MVEKKKNRIPDEKQLISVTEKLAQELEEQSKQLDELRETVRLYFFLNTVTVTICFGLVRCIFIFTLCDCCFGLTSLLEELLPDIYFCVCLCFLITVPKVTDLNVELMYKSVMQRDK